MKRFLASVTVVFGLLAGAALSPAHGADVKIGYFDLQAVLDQSRWGKQAKEEFQAKKAEMQSEVKEKSDAFQQARESFEKQQAMLDDEAKRKKVTELRKMQLEGEKLLMQTNTELNRLSQELTAPIIDKIIEIVQKMGKDQKYDYIFEVQKGGLVYATEKTDLTKAVIKELDKAAPAKP